MWVNCEDRLPKETKQGECMLSEMFEVELTDGTLTTDCPVNGKWLIYCKHSCSTYPVKWFEKEDNDE